MSYKATHWAYGLPIAGSPKFVLVALADMADGEDTCFPGQRLIAEMTGLSVATVRRCMIRLEEAGLITRQHRHTQFGYRTSDRYKLELAMTLPESLPLNLPSAQDAHKASRPSLPLILDAPTAHGAGASLTTREPPEEPPVVKASPRGSRLSADWWPSVNLLGWATLHLPGVDVVGETPNFIDYWIAQAGARALKADWDATWRGWMRRQRTQNANRKPTPEERARQTLALATDIDMKEIGA